MTMVQRLLAAILVLAVVPLVQAPKAALGQEVSVELAKAHRPQSRRVDRATAMPSGTVRAFMAAARPAASASMPAA